MEKRAFLLKNRHFCTEGGKFYNVFPFKPSFFWIIIYLIGTSYQMYGSRPLNTEDAIMTGKKVFQIEASWDYFHWSPQLNENIPILVFTYGLSSRLDISAEIPYIISRNHTGLVHGIGDALLGCKYLLLTENATIPNLALSGILKSETADARKGLGVDQYELTFLGSASKTLSRFIFHGMFAYTLGENHPDVLDFGFAMEYTHHAPLIWVAEVTSTNFVSSLLHENITTVFGGLYFPVNKRITLDGGIRWGLSETSPRWNLTTGATIIF